MKKTFLSSLFVLLHSIVGFAQNTEAQQKLKNAERHYFIENKGQWDADVLFLCRMGGLDVWITKYGINYTFYRMEKLSNPDTEGASDMPKGEFEREEMENTMLLGHRVLMKLQNHNPEPQREGRQKQQGYHNYLIGNDAGKHASFVGLYKEAVVKEVYPGIDMRYYFDRGRLRYDYIVHPGADPSQIRFELEGQYDAYLKDGNLYFTTRFGEVAMAELYTYQGNRSVESWFEKQGNEWKIAVGNYDPTQDLIIDPLLYSTYLGGSADDYGYDIAIDGSGNAYVTGLTFSTDYDITAGAFQATNGGGVDVFVTKLNSTGTALLYSTYLGGSSYDYGYGIAVDGSGNAYVTGWTFSTNYDITAGAFQTTNEGGGDVFVTKLNSTGTALVYSTYLGGSGYDYGYDIAVDGSGNAYVTGRTGSTNYDITAGAFQTTNEGGGDVFVTKLNSTGTALLYSTYLGGSNGDNGQGIAVDGSGNAYVTGLTNSTNYDITAGAFQTTHGGGTYSDVFVTKLNSTGTALVYSTYLGGSGADEGLGIAVDGSGNAYVTGYTYGNYDITAGAFQTTNGGVGDVFVTKLNSTGTALVYSTYLGGSATDYGDGIAIDGSGNAYVTGYTNSTNYDITAGAFQTTNEGGGDVFVTKLNSTGTALFYSTYLGGSATDYGDGIAVDGSGNAYVTGWTGSTNYDVTAGAFQTTYGGGSYDVFVTKLSTCPPVTVTASGNSPVCAGQTLTLSVNSISGATYSWSGPNGFSSTAQNPSISNVTTAYSGTYTVTVTVGGCSYSSSVNVTVNPLPNVTATASPSSVCQGQSSTLTASGAVSYTWSGGLGSGSTVTATPTTTTTYTVTGTDANGCQNTANVTVTVNPLPNVTATASPSSVCQGQSSTLTASGAVSYTWSGGLGSGSTVTATPTTTTTYTVTGTDANGCQNTANVTVTVNPLPNVTATASPSSICQGQSSTLTASGAGSYTWSGGLGSGSTKTVSPSTTTTYTVTGTDANGCQNTANVTVTVNPLPNVTATASPSSVCQGQSSTLTASGAVSYTWSGGLGSGSTKTVSPSTTTTYTVTGTDANGCQNTANVTVTVTPLPMVTASSNSPVCEGGALTLQVNSVSGGVYSWMGPNGYTSALQNPVLSPVSMSDSGKYVVEVTVNGCTGKDSVYVVVEPSPVLTVGGGGPVCEGGSVTLTAGGTGVSYVWSGPLGYSGSGTSVTLSGLTLSESGWYVVEAMGSNGCSRKDSVSVQVNGRPVVGGEVISDTCGRGVGEIRLMISGGVKPYTIQWEDGEVGKEERGGLTTGSYAVEVTDVNGCRDSATFVLMNEEVGCDRYVYVPTAFSPNGDGLNDELRLIHQGVKSVRWMIFNRWGNKVYETEDVNGGWDGRYRGEEQPMGVYAYVLEVEYVDGSRETLSGDVTLIR